MESHGKPEAYRTVWRQGCFTNSSFIFAADYFLLTARNFPSLLTEPDAAATSTVADTVTYSFTISFADAAAKPSSMGRGHVV